MYAPTHRGHTLDRIYCTAPIYSNTKVVEATVKTEHKAIVARVNLEPIINFNKSKRTVELRRHTPAQIGSMLCFLQAYRWHGVCLNYNMQSAADSLYCILNYILNVFFPVTKITVSSRDPDFVTPEIKMLLRDKNVLMRKGRMVEADIISAKVRNAIFAHDSVSFKFLNSRGGSKAL